MTHVFTLLITLMVGVAAGVPANGTFIESSYLYHLPQPFDGPQPQDGNRSTNYLSSSTNSSEINDLFLQAKNSTYYAFDPEFYELLGSHTPEIVQIAAGDEDVYYEGGEWLPDRDEIWFTSLIPSSILKFDLSTNVTTPLSIPAMAHLNPLGTSYYNGSVWFACGGNFTVPNGTPAVYSVDPETLEATNVIDSYWGLRFENVDDLTWVKSNTSNASRSCTHDGESNLFFTSFSFASQGHNTTGPKVEALPDAVWRYTPELQTVQGVISRADVLAPNGIRVDPTGRFLYVSDTAGPQNHGNAPAGGGAQSSGSSAIYRYELDEDCMPFNKKLFAIVRSYADGLRVDDYGRVWSAEYDGIVVRNSRGKVLGVFNAYALLKGTTVSIANFALVRDRLFILAVNRLYVVQLGQTVAQPAQ